MSVVDWLRDRFRPHQPEPLRSEADRAMDRWLEEVARDRREVAEARRVIGAWGDPIAEGLTRQLGVPVVFDPDPRDLEAVRAAMRGARGGLDDLPVHGGRFLRADRR